MAQRVFAAGARIGDDPDLLGLEGKRDDLAVEFFAGQLEVADSSIVRVLLTGLSEAALCGLDSGREATVQPPASTGPQRSGGRRKPSLLSREECGEAAGEEGWRSRCGQRPGRRQTNLKRGRSGRVRASVPEERYWRYRNVRHASGTSGTIDAATKPEARGLCPVAAQTAEPRHAAKGSGDESSLDDDD